MWHNLGEAVDKTVAAHHACIRAHLAAVPVEALPPEPPAPGDGALVVPAIDTMRDAQVEVGDTTDVCGRQRTLVARTRQRYADIQQHLADGASLSAICRTMDLDRTTVRRFARATSIEELLVKACNRTSLLDGYTDHLDQPWAAGITDAGILYQHIRTLGFTGSVQTVQRYLRPLRPAAQATPAARARRTARPAIPKPRLIVRWIMTEQGRLTPEQRTQLDRVLDSCPELQAIAARVREFAQMMATRHGDQLTAWMRTAQADNLPALHSLINGLRRDQDAVTAGLTLNWSSGPVEGNVNRIKTIKRQMYRRASLPLLRKRILLAS